VKPKQTKFDSTSELILWKSIEVTPMIRTLWTLNHHPAAYLIAFLSLVVLTLVANRLGLIAWLAWLDRREDMRGGEVTREYWKLHQ
jgi:hypothetical protein